MKYIFTLLLVLFSIKPLASQNLIDNISFTDIEGQSHSVHNYCNQGKTVVLYFFFVNCGICNVVTPVMQTIYDANGGDNGCLEILALDVLDDDSVASIQQYASSKQAEFPFCSNNSNILMTFINEFSSAGTPGILIINSDKEITYAGNGSITYNTLNGLIETALGQSACTTSITHTPTEMPLTIYPTLANDYITLQSNVLLWDNLSIYNTSGQQLLSKNNHNGSQIEISSLPSGVYYIHAIHNNNYATTKFIKQ